jgi:cytoskeleton protein RodZ
VKELGEYLKTIRENNGVALEEAADDLKTDSFLLGALEEGNVRAFKDVLKIKDLVKDYAKYLGLDSEKVILEYNDFLFEHTSKISLKDILDAEKTKEEEDKKVVSPYTYVKRKKVSKKTIKKVLEVILIMIVLILFVIFLFRPKENKIIDEIMIRGDIYEFTK